MTPAQPLLVSTARLERVDALRTAAMVWMTVFHLCFDLNHFGFIQQNFYTDPLWTWQRSAIVSLFLFTAGLSQAVAVYQQQSGPRFWKRWAQVAACAMLVSAGSWLVFPESWIYFGVLHGLAVMLLLARWLAMRQVSTVRLVAFAALALTLYLLVQNLGPMGHWPAVFNGKPLSWLGLNWRKPITEDFVPLLPWLAPLLLGLALGQRSLNQQVNGWLLTPVPRVLRLGVTWGQWSLLYYMLHQPVLLGLLWLARHLYTGS